MLRFGLRESRSCMRGARESECELREDPLHWRTSMRIPSAFHSKLASVSLASAVLLVHSASLSASAFAVETPVARVPAPGDLARASHAYQAAVHQGPLAIQAFLAD